MNKERRKDIKAVILWILVFAFLALLFVPMRLDMKRELPAVVINRATVEITETVFNMDGHWVWRNIWPFGVKYEGKIEIDSLDFTHVDEGFLNDIQFRTVQFSEDDVKLKQGSWFYYSPGDVTGFAFMWADTDYERIYISISGGSPNDDEEEKEYIVVAPAESEEEAIKILNELGISYSY